jgi:uncharacterized membrane protein HdeD (DUF308 family)
MEAALPPDDRDRAPDLLEEAREGVRQVSRFWWLWLAFGIVWTLIAVTILQFDGASVTTIGVILGIMFLATGLQSFVAVAVVDHWGWAYGLLGVIMVLGGIATLISPADTFATLADILGFLFLIVGIGWTLQAFGWREQNDLWWVGLLSGVLMIVLAFWTSGQLLIEKEYMLLVFGGIWALMHGVTDIVRAFQIRRLGQLV